MTRRWLALAIAGVVAPTASTVIAQSAFVPVTDAMLEETRSRRLADVAAHRRQLGLQPARRASTAATSRGSHSRGPSISDEARRKKASRSSTTACCTSRARSDVTTAFDAATGKKLWEHRRALPADLGQFVPFPQTNRNLAIYGRLIIDNGADDFIYALDAVTRRAGLGNQDPRLQDPPREAGLGAARRERRADRGTQLPAERRPRRVHHHGPRRAHGQGALAQAHDPEARRARRRQLGRRARRASAGTSARG